MLVYLKCMLCCTVTHDHNLKVHKDFDEPCFSLNLIMLSPHKSMSSRLQILRAGNSKRGAVLGWREQYRKMMLAPLRIHYVHGLDLKFLHITKFSPDQTPFPFTFYRLCKKYSPQNATSLQHACEQSMDVKVAKWHAVNSLWWLSTNLGFPI